MGGVTNPGSIVLAVFALVVLAVVATMWGAHIAYRPYLRGQR